MSFTIVSSQYFTSTVCHTKCWETKEQISTKTWKNKISIGTEQILILNTGIQNFTNVHP